MTYISPYIAITSREGVRKFSSDETHYISLDVELRPEHLCKHEFQLECMTPPDRVICDYGQFSEENQSPAEKLEDVTAEGLPSSLRTEINKIYLQLKQGEGKNRNYHELSELSHSCQQSENLECSESCPDPHHPRRRRAERVLSTQIQDLAVFSKCANWAIEQHAQKKMGNSATARKNASTPKTTIPKQTHSKGPTGLLWVETTQAFPPNQRLLSTIQSFSSRNEYLYPSHHQFTQPYSESAASSFPTTSIQPAKYLKKQQLRIANSQESYEAVSSSDPSSISPVLEHKSVITERTSSVSPHRTTERSSSFQDHNIHFGNTQEYKFERPPALTSSGSATELNKAKLHHLPPPTAFQEAVHSRDHKYPLSGPGGPHRGFTSELETLQQSLHLSNPAPRPKHLSNKEGHLGLSPTSAERAIALDKGYGDNLPKKMIDMKNIPRLGLTVKKQDADPTSSKGIHRRTTSNTNLRINSASNSPVMHPHEVAAQDFGSRRSSMSVSSRSSSVNSSSSRFAARNGGSRQSSPSIFRTLSTGISSLGRKNSLSSKPCKHELLENELDLPHYQLPTAQSRLRDIRNTGDIDSPTPAARSGSSTTPYYDRHQHSSLGSNNNFRQRRMSSGSLMLREHEDSVLELAGRTSSASNASSSARRSADGKKPGYSLGPYSSGHRKSESLIFLKDDIENIHGIPFSLEAKIGSGSKRTRDFNVESDHDYAHETSSSTIGTKLGTDELDLKTLQIELAGVKKLVGMLQERIAMHENEYPISTDGTAGVVSKDITKAGNNGPAASISKESKRGEHLQKESLSELEKEAHDLLEILERKPEKLSKTETSEIQGHLSNLTRGLAEEKSETSSKGKDGAKGAELVGSKTQHQNTQTGMSGEGSRVAVKRNNNNRSSHAMLWTSLVVFLTCVGTYGFVSLYLFLIEYTENTSTPF